MARGKREPVWLSLDEILAIHDEQVVLFGGGAGLLKRGALEALVARPLNVSHYQADADLPLCAAIYLVGLINGHVFVDGNKRVGLAAMLVFLKRNGRPLHVHPVELFDLVLGIATGRVREDEARAWIRGKLA